MLIAELQKLDPKTLVVLPSNHGNFIGPTSAGAYGLDFTKAHHITQGWFNEKTGVFQLDTEGDGGNNAITIHG
jgi:hypothetical protein